MQTTDLIEQLTQTLEPVPRRAALARIVTGLAAGAAIALLAVWIFLGVRSDFSWALHTLPFWRKWVFAIGVMLAALALCVRLGRPEGTPGKLPLALMAPFLMLGILAILELRETPPGERMELWLGGSALKCPWLITALALPVFAGALWAFRQLAPTRLRLAGFSAGCLAGAVAAFVYAVHCNEGAAAFVVSWYSAGILLPAVLGAWAGPYLLRW